MFVKIVDNPPHDGRWYSSMIGEVIKISASWKNKLILDKEM